MASAAQINANRLNAQRSTGPRTLEGKVASARNALTSGLYTKRDYVRPEEQDYYESFTRALASELDPVNLMEGALVDEVVSATWRLRLCGQAEAGLGDFDEATDKQRRSIERARAAAHSILHRNLNQLRKLRTERPANHGSFVKTDRPGLIPTKAPSPTTASGQLASFCNPAGVASICNTVSSHVWNPLAKAPDVVQASKESGSICKQAPQTPRNAPCPCRSGEKFKRCCGKSSPPVLGKAA